MKHSVISQFRRTVFAWFALALWLFVFSVWTNIWWHRHPMAIDFPYQYNWTLGLLFFLLIAAVVMLCLDLIRYLRNRKSGRDG
jgi:hypothetical protein